MRTRTIILVVFVLCMALSGKALATSSTHYCFPLSTYSSGGSLKTTTRYILTDVFGSVASSISDSANYQLSLGYASYVAGTINSEATQDSIVRIEPISQEVLTEDTFDVEVVIEPVTAISGVQFNLSFDSSKITAHSVAEGNLLNHDGSNTGFDSGTINNTTGTISDVYGYIKKTGELPTTVSSTGTLAIITFTACTTNGTSLLTLVNVIIGDKNGNPLNKKVNDGIVNIRIKTQHGDANGDGVVNVLDISKVARIILIRDSETAGADANQDGVINVFDMTKIARIILGLD